MDKDGKKNRKVRNTRAKGARLEYRVRDTLKRGGLFVVRQASSAFPDLIAVGIGEVYAIECKWNNNATKTEKETLLKISKDYEMKPMIAFNSPKSPNKWDWKEVTFDDI